MNPCASRWTGLSVHDWTWSVLAICWVAYVIMLYNHNAWPHYMMSLSLSFNNNPAAERELFVGHICRTHTLDSLEWLNAFLALSLAKHCSQYRLHIEVKTFVRACIRLLLWNTNRVVFVWSLPSLSFKSMGQNVVKKVLWVQL